MGSSGINASTFFFFFFFFFYIVSLRTLSYASKFKCYVETTQQRPQRVATECLLGHGLAQPRARLLARVARREGGEPQEALATRAEAGARDGDDLRRLEQLGEYVPRALALQVDEDVGRVVAAVHLKAQVEHRVLQNLRVAHVVVDELLDPH